MLQTISMHHERTPHARITPYLAPFPHYIQKIKPEKNQGTFWIVTIGTGHIQGMIASKRDSHHGRKHSVSTRPARCSCGGTSPQRVHHLLLLSHVPRIYQLRPSLHVHRRPSLLSPTDAHGYVHVHGVLPLYMKNIRRFSCWISAWLRLGVCYVSVSAHQYMDVVHRCCVRNICVGFCVLYVHACMHIYVCV
jgi:hypothetical protein